MSDRTFLTISQEECLLVYQELLLNSKKKWEIGKVLAEAHQYGDAIAYLIISNEELIKSMILFFDGRGFKFRRTKGMRILFKNHEIRHVISYCMFAISIFGQDLLLFAKRYDSSPDKFSAPPSAIMEWIEIYFATKNDQLSREFEWFSNIDQLRQLGFYSDYTGEFRSPLSATESQYQETFTKLKKVREVGLDIIRSFDSKDPSIIKQLECMRRSMARNDYYERISEILLILRRSNSGIFGFLRSRLPLDNQT